MKPGEVSSLRVPGEAHQGNIKKTGRENACLPGLRDIMTTAPRDPFGYYQEDQPGSSDTAVTDIPKRIKWTPEMTGADYQ